MPDNSGQTWLPLLVAVGKAFLAWAAFLALAYFVKRGVDSLCGWISNKFAVFATEDRTRGVMRLLWERLFMLLLLTVKFIAVLFVFFQFSVLVSYTLGLFPATAHISISIFQYFGEILSTIVEAVIGYLPSGAFVLILGIITFYGLRVLQLLFMAVERQDISLRGFHPDAAMPTFQLLRILVILFAIVVAFPYLPGGNSDAFKGVSIFIGVLLSLGSSSAMGNVMAGVIITYMRPFRVGDIVKVSEETGAVIAKNLLVTRIRTFKNVEVVVPNSAILNGQILNFSERAREGGLILNTTVMLGYDAPWRTIHTLMKEAALATPGILPQPEPFVLQTALNDFNVSYQLNAFTASPEIMPDLYSGLHQNIQERFNAAGLEIMSPNYFALRDGNTVTIPAAQRPPGYQPPSFRVKTS